MLYGFGRLALVLWLCAVGGQAFTLFAFHNAVAEAHTAEIAARASALASRVAASAAERAAIGFPLADQNDLQRLIEVASTGGGGVRLYVVDPRGTVLFATAQAAGTPVPASWMGGAAGLPAEPWDLADRDGVLVGVPVADALGKARRRRAGPRSAAGRAGGGSGRAARDGDGHPPSSWPPLGFSPFWARGFCCPASAGPFWSGRLSTPPRRGSCRPTHPPPWRSPIRRCPPSWPGCARRRPRPPASTGRCCDDPPGDAVPQRSVLRRFIPLMAVVVVVPWLATLAAALIAAAGLADRGTASRAEIVGTGIAHDLEKALALGLPLDRMAGMDDYLGEAGAVFPEIKLILVVDGAGRPLFQKSDAARPDLSVRLVPAETDWSALGLVLQRFPIRQGAATAGEVLLGRSAVAQPANAPRILIDFAVALSIALALGGLALRTMLNAQVMAPLRLASSLEANLARSAYDRIAPPVEQSLIGTLLAEMNRVVTGVNDRFARLRSYLAEVRDLSFNKDAAAEVAPLIERIERLGRFSPDRLTALAPPDAGSLPYATAFCAGVVAAAAAAMAARHLPPGIALGGVVLGMAAAVPLAFALGRRAPVAGALALGGWALLNGLGDGAAVWLTGVVLGGAVLGGLSAALPFQAARPAAESLRAGPAVSAAGGLVAGTGLSVLCIGGGVPGVLMAGAVLSGLAGLLAAVRLERRSGLTLPRVTLRALLAVDRWWADGTLRPRGWGLWLVTALALAVLSRADGGGAMDARRVAELFWLHATPAWLAAALVAVLVPRGGAGLLSLGATAAVALLPALGPVEPGNGRPAGDPRGAWRRELRDSRRPGNGGGLNAGPRPRLPWAGKLRRALVCPGGKQNGG
ncbi:hypothetical protein, partial [Azospirillum baldaniorum]